MNDVVKQLGCLLHCSLDQGFVFDPFGEFIDADVDPAKTSQHRLERPNHIQSPACEGLRCRNRLQGLGWDVDLLSKKLTILAPVNECHGIGNCRRPMETSSEGFIDQSSRGCVIAASADMDLLEYLLALFHGDALLE